MKKITSLILSVLLICVSLSACKTDESKPSPDTSEAQIKLIAENYEIWKPTPKYNTDRYKFCVTDLDMNNRLEVVVSACIGTGLSSFTSVYEVSEDYLSLDVCGYLNDESYNEVKADIITNSLDCFIDPESSQPHYIFVDHIRGGYSYNAKFTVDLTFDNSTINEKVIAFWENRYEIADNDEGYTATTTIKSVQGEEISSEDYWAYPEKLYKNFEKHTVSLKWQDTYNGDEKSYDISESQLISLLTESYREFSVAPAKSIEELKTFDAQLQLIADNTSLWLSPFYAISSLNTTPSFCVTDLNNNGRLEIICAVKQGSGISTTSIWAEVSANFTTLVSAQKNFNPKAAPDIIVSSTDCFINPDTGERVYSFFDTTRASGDHSTHTLGLLTFKNHTINFEPIAICESTTQTSDNSTRTETFKDTDGKPLTEEEFDCFAESYLKGYEKHTAAFSWKKATTDPQELKKLLKESYKSFSVK